MINSGARPKLLDLFCGAGGATRGYQQTGFHVTGIDIDPQPRYIGDAFHQADALTYLAEHGHEFDAIHASPPCQGYSVTASLHTAEYPLLIEDVRALLLVVGRPCAIENVVGAPLLNPVRLCGSSFGLGVRRHRLFELSFPVLFPPPCAHHLQPEPVDVTGTGGRRLDPRSGTRHQGGGDSRKPLNLAHAREVMGIDWMRRAELSEAIPPVYTEWIGEQLTSTLELAQAA